MMLNSDAFESGVQRIGAEQELFIIDGKFRPAPEVIKLLNTVNDPHFVTEYAKFNVEFNLEPIPFTRDCLSALHNCLLEQIHKLSYAAENLGLDLAMVGILPTIRQSDLSEKNITPLERYYALTKALKESRNESYEYYIKGLDELLVKLDSTVFDFCNTAFQIHLQVDTDKFTNAYNCAQLISGPVLSCATNSPLLLGKRLWKETRIELASQAIDTRSRKNLLSNENSRVSFANGWLNGSIIDIFKEDISSYRTLLTSESPEDSVEALMKGNIPAFNALRTFNGTIYKWNRACYGVCGGKPHLRIENRYLPSGPSVIDEAANAALWFGLMNNLPDIYSDISASFDFDEASSNFTKAAQNGSESQLCWQERYFTPAELINKQLLPLAYEGLAKANIDKEDIEKYLGIISERISSGKTGSRWQLNSYSKLKKYSDKDDTLVALTSLMVKLQKQDIPVHVWKEAGLEDLDTYRSKELFVDQVMNKKPLIVKHDDICGFALSLMKWNQLCCIPVEDNDGFLKGYLKIEDLLSADEKLPVTEFLRTDTATIDKDVIVSEAERRLRHLPCGVIYITENRRLIGSLTSKDIESVYSSAV